MRENARVEPTEGGRSYEARLVDVSAGGLRALVTTEPAPRVGQMGNVEIVVAGLQPPGKPPRVRLRGAAKIVRVEQAEAGGYPMALRFTGPLDMREPFSTLLLYCGGGDDPAGLAEIPGDRIFLAQIADAPALPIDLETKQHCLEDADPAARLRLVQELVNSAR